MKPCNLVDLVENLAQDQSFPNVFSHWSSRLSGMRLRFQKWSRPIYAVLGIFCVILPLGSQGEAGAQANKLSKNWDVGHP
jgi:hypothetical protein